ncbi:MAG: hypothetical protein AAGI45_18945 [Cyanobacteria bacterium P01_H01_bin.26]
MSLSKPLRAIILGLISLLGLLILVGVIAWWHNWAYGMLNPDKVQPTEDWTLELGLGIFAIQLAVAVEVLLIALVTRFRWLKFNRARNAIGLFSLILLAFALPGFTGITSAAPGSIGAGLLYLLYLIVPVIPAWGLLYFRRARDL